MNEKLSIQFLSHQLLPLSAADSSYQLRRTTRSFFLAKKERKGAKRQPRLFWTFNNRPSDLLYNYYVEILMYVSYKEILKRVNEEFESQIFSSRITRSSDVRCD